MITKTNHAFLDFKHIIKYDTIFQHSSIKEEKEFLKIQKLYSTDSQVRGSVKQL